MTIFPDAPDVPDAQRAAATFALRYEDIAQDGRLALEASVVALGEAVWKKALARSPVVACFARGVVPILSRLAIEGGGGPFSVDAEIAAEGLYEMFHVANDAGEVERLCLNMWAEITAPIGRTHGAPPPRAGERIVAARIFAEHVFTRLFAPPEERKVLALDLPDVPRVPPRRYAPRAPSALLDLPDGAAWLEPALRFDDAIAAFGLRHTDSNQHVNSLVYPVLFEEALLRRAHQLRKPTALLSRSIEIAFRKPFFAGQAAKLALRAFERGDRVGAVGAFVAASEDDATSARPHAYVRMTLAP